MNADTVLEIDREMTISHADFLRLLSPALQGLCYRRDGNTIEVDAGHGRGMTIRLSEQAQRRLGAMTLPVTRVQVTLSGDWGEDAGRFMDRFDLAYQRGGG